MGFLSVKVTMDPPPPTPPAEEERGERKKIAKLAESGRSLAFQ